MMTDPFLNVDPLLATLKLPPKLEPFRAPIQEEIRWLFHTLYVTQRVYRVNSHLCAYIVYGITLFIKRYNPLHLCPYISEYDLSIFYGLKPRYCWKRIHDIERFLKERYKKKS